MQYTNKGWEVATQVFEWISPISLNCKAEETSITMLSILAYKFLQFTCLCICKIEIILLLIHSLF